VDSKNGREGIKMVRDYTNEDIPEDKHAFYYSRKERIAELTKRLLGYGLGPDYINKKSLGKRYDVSHTQIYKDLKVIAKSIEEYKNLDNLDVDETFKAWIEGHDLDLEPYSKTKKANKSLPRGIDSYDQLPDSVKHDFPNPDDNTDNRPNKPKDVPSYEDKVKSGDLSSDSKDGRPNKPKDVPNYKDGNKSSETNNERPRKPEDIPNYQSENTSSEKNNQSNERTDFIPYNQLPDEVKKARSKDAWERLDEVNPKLKKRLCNEVREKKAKGEYD